MNDDFLYTRQESPAPEFVAELSEKLRQLEEPQKAKRKNGQGRFNWKWKAVAAVVSLILLGTFIWNQPEINIPLKQMIFGHPDADELQDARETMGIDIPDTPNGYYLFSAEQNMEFDLQQLLIHWQSYRGFCVIDLFVFADPETPEALQHTQEYNRQLAESFSWADIVELGSDVEAIWRATTYNGQPLGVSLEWYFEGNMYNLSSTEECATKEVLAAMAQSMLSENP